MSDRACEKLDSDSVNTRRKRRFNVKGVPRDMAAFSVEPN